MNEGKSKQDGQALSNPAEMGVEFAARRRVIRGLTSVPIALTLGNGAAQANASSHQCLTNQEPGVHPACVADPAAKDPRWDYSDAAVAPYNNNNKEKAKYCVKYAKEFTPGQPPALTGYLYDNKDGSKVFLTVDQFGNVNGSSSSPIGNPLTTSCAISFV